MPSSAPTPWVTTIWTRPSTICLVRARRPLGWRALFRREAPCASSRSCAVAGGGVGSSFIVQMNVESLLKKHGIEGVSVDHVSVSEISMHKVDLYVVGSDLAPFLKDKPRVVTLDNIMSMPELEEKLLAAFAAEAE